MKPRMPRTVRVGCHDYAIVRKASENNGWCDFDSLEIWVHPKLGRSKAQEILLHELMHACTYPELNDAGPVEDERFVNTITPRLLSLLKTNPALVEYLTQ